MRCILQPMIVVTAVTVGMLCLAAGSDAAANPPRDRTKQPNIILCMTDDQGWGDTSYNGLKQIKTATLDEMAAHGIRFNRFYAAHPSCSPTRASVMTGRHPYRMGCLWPGMPLKIEERTIAQVVKRAGYSTAHFGKWHLSGGKPGAGRPLPLDDPLHPGHFGFDYWFTVSNWFDLDWTFSRQGELVKVEGDGSDAIVAEALTYIEKQAKADQPFLALIWFGSPHIPLKPTAADKQTAGGSDYYGELVGVDRAMGTLRKKLRDLGLADDTMLWFNSDNGAWMDEKAAPDTYGSNSALRGKKGELWEGGIRVPGIVEWPARIKKPRVCDTPVVTSDFLPTLAELLKVDLSDQARPLDGLSLMPLIAGEVPTRTKPIGFWHHGEKSLEDGPVAWIDNQYKLHKRPENKFELYDLTADIGEQHDLAAQRPEIVEKMKAQMEAWLASVRKSARGEDYPQK